MLVRFFTDLRAGGVPVTLPEFLSLLEALEARLAMLSPEDFYYLARLSLVKDERHFDRFDRVFAEHFAGAERLFEKLVAELPPEWLAQLSERLFSEEEKRRVETLGGWQKLLDTLRQRLLEQKSVTRVAAAGSARRELRLSAIAATTPRGCAWARAPGGRVARSRCGRRASTRISMRRANSVPATSRWRCAACGASRARARPRSSTSTGPSVPPRATAAILDIRLQPERRNAVKLLLLLDVGGSMDPHVRICEELFSAVRSEFRHLEYFYFHNFPYERLWKDNGRRFSEITDTWKLLRTFNADYRVVFVGDASMSPYEIEQPGGSVEHWNEETGRVWMERIVAHFPRLVWLNPEPEDRWNWTPSIQITRGLVGQRMFPLTLDGIDRAMREIKRKTPYTAPDVS